MVAPGENIQEDRVYWKLHVQESLGTIFLGIVCIMLLVSLWKSEERNKTLMYELMGRR
jgi:hypothetical protein